MSQWILIHEVLIKTQFVYPLLLMIFIFSIYETKREYLERKEQKNGR